MKKEGVWISVLVLSALLISAPGCKSKSKDEGVASMAKQMRKMAEAGKGLQMDRSDAMGMACATVVAAELTMGAEVPKDCEPYRKEAYAVLKEQCAQMEGELPPFCAKLSEGRGESKESERERLQTKIEYNERIIQNFQQSIDANKAQMKQIVASNHPQADQMKKSMEEAVTKLEQEMKKFQSENEKLRKELRGL